MNLIKLAAVTVFAIFVPCANAEMPINNAPQSTVFGDSFLHIPELNQVYGKLIAIINLQGHKQLGDTPWQPGVNDLSEEQLLRLDYRKIDFTRLNDSTFNPGEISYSERVRQVVGRKQNDYENIKTLSNLGELKPLSNLSLSQDQLNQLLHDAFMEYETANTPDAHAKYIAAVGMASARRLDILSAHQIMKFMTNQINP